MWCYVVVCLFFVVLGVFLFGGVFFLLLLFFFLLFFFGGREVILSMSFLKLSFHLIVTSLLILITGNSVFAIFTLLSSLIAMSGASGCFGIMFSFTPEMYPTNLRYVELFNQQKMLVYSLSTLQPRKSRWFVFPLCNLQN